MTNTTVTKQELVDEFNAVVTETEHLLKSFAAVGGDKAQALRESVEQNLRAAKERLRQFQGVAVEKARSAARSTDEYVHENPWQSIAIAAAVAAIAGIVLGLLLNRR